MKKPEITHATIEAFAEAIGLTIEMIKAHKITLWAGESEGIHTLAVPDTRAPDVRDAVTWREISYVPAQILYPLLEGTEYGDYYLTDSTIVYFRDYEGKWFTTDKPRGG